MFIDLNEILTEAGREKSFNVKLDSEVLDYHYQNLDVIESDTTLAFTNEGNKNLSLKADIYAKLNIPCDRCIEPTEVCLKFSVNKDLDMKKTSKEREEELDECIFLQNMNFDTEVFLKNEILVNLPMKVLCSEDCKGICNKCGTNLNNGSCDCDTTELDPRMSKILDVFNQFKEV